MSKANKPQLPPFNGFPRSIDEALRWSESLMKPAVPTERTGCHTPEIKPERDEPKSFVIEVNHPEMPRDRFVVEQTSHSPVGWAARNMLSTFTWIVVKVSVYRDNSLVWSGFITWSSTGSVLDLFYRVEIAMRKANGGGHTALAGPPLLAKAKQ